MMLIDFPHREFPLYGSEASDTREPGWHVTDIILDLLHTLGAMERDEEITPTIRRQWERGFRWEDTLVLCYRNKLAPRVEPFQVDGIWMSPDGFDEMSATVHEYKSTKKSMRKWSEWTEGESTDFTYWIWQAKAYCVGLSRLYDCHVGRLRWWVFFENGNYSKGAGTAREFDATKGMEWSSSELEEHWEMILNHRLTMEARDGART